MARDHLQNMRMDVPAAQKPGSQAARQPNTADPCGKNSQLRIPGRELWGASLCLGRTATLSSRIGSGRVPEMFPFFVNWANTKQTNNMNTTNQNMEQQTNIFVNWALPGSPARHGQPASWPARPAGQPASRPPRLRGSWPQIGRHIAGTSRSSTA